MVRADAGYTRLDFATSLSYLSLLHSADFEHFCLKVHSSLSGDFSGFAHTGNRTENDH